MGVTNLDELSVTTLDIGGTDVTATAAEVNKLAGVTAGAATASKALVVGATKNIDTLLVDVASPAAAGANQGNATAMTADTNLVTASDGAKGVKLPVAVAGRRIFVKNTVENQTLLVYPATDAAINDLGANAAFTIPSGGQAVFLASSAAQWYTGTVLDGITASAAELNLNDGAVAGTAVASKTLALGADKNVDTLAIADGGLKLGAGAGTAVNATADELNKAADATALLADGLIRYGVARATYDFAEDGGAISAIDLGVSLPDNAVIIGGFVDVITTLTSATDAGTMAISVEGANDIVSAIAINDGGNPWDAGKQAIVPKANTPESTGVKTTAARAITATIAVEAVTAGKFVVFLLYVVSD